MTQENKLKPGDLEFCDSDGNCRINLGFIPDFFSMDKNGNYTATKGGKCDKIHKGIVPYDPR